MPFKAVKNRGVKMSTRVGVDEGKIKSRRESFSFEVFIYKVLKEIHPDIGISMKAMCDTNSFLQFMFKRIAAVASHLARCNNSNEITVCEVEAAVRLLLTGELAKQAVREGNIAVAKEKSYICLPKPKVKNQGSQKKASQTSMSYGAVEKDGGVKMSTRAGDKKRRRRESSIEVALYKVLKQVQRDIGISKKAVRDMNSFMQFMCKRIAAVASHLARCNNSDEITVREVDAAVRLLVTGDLSKLAEYEGNPESKGTSSTAVSGQQVRMNVLWLYLLESTRISFIMIAVLIFINITQDVLLQE